MKTFGTKFENLSKKGHFPLKTLISGSYWGRPTLAARALYSLGL